MPSLIQQIIEKIEAIPIGGDGKMLMKVSDFGLDFMNAFFSNVLQEDSILLSDAKKDKTSPDSITVTGIAGLYGYIDLSLSLVFNVQEGQVVGTVTGVFSLTYQPQLPVLSWIRVGNISLSSAISENFLLVDFDFKADILSSTGGKSIPIEFRNQSGSTWQINIKEGTNQGITAEEIVSLLAGQAIDQFIPSSLAAILAGFSLNSLEVSYNTELKTISFFAIGISVTNGWEIAPKKVVLLPGLQINMTLLPAIDNKNTQATGNVIGTFQLGGVNVPAYLGASVGGTTVWSFGLQPGKTVTLPSFSNLLELAGGEEFMKGLPDGLSAIPQIQINKLLVEFNATLNVLTRLSFAVSTASSWPVISGYFEIEKLSIDFDITNLTDPLTRTIYGYLYGLFKIGATNYIMCSIEKSPDNPDWTIIGGLPPGATLSLTSIALQLFEGKVKVPDGVPDFTFTILQLKVVPSKQSFSFDAGSTDTWPIINTISINAFKLSFTRSADDPLMPVKGSISSTIQVSNVRIDLSASLNDTPDGGWQFTGKTKQGDPIAIGDLITYVISKFNVPEPPAWIKTITLQDLLASFNTTSKDFTFGVTAKITFTTTSLDITTKFQLIHDGKNNYTDELDGTITIKYTDRPGSAVFRINFKTGTTDTRLLASWTASTPADYIQFRDIVHAFGFELPDFPEQLDLALKSASLLYDFTTSTLAFSLQSATYGKAVFVAMKNPADQKWIFYFGLASDCVINLADLPILDKLTVIDAGKLEISKINVNIASIATNAALATAINSQIQALLPDYNSYPQIPAAGINGQVAFSMSVNIGGTLYPVNLVLGSTSTTATTTEVHTVTTAGITTTVITTTAITTTTVWTLLKGRLLPSLQGNGSPSLQEDGTPALLNQDSPKAVWFNIQKNFGPLYFDKIGLGYKDGHIYVLVNVMATASGLSIALNGFGIGVSISNFDIAFNLDGISITYMSGPILISGGFQGSFHPVNLYGDILVKTTSLTIGGIGGYTETAGRPSMFLYAVLNFPIGGPPFFFVTGLAAGFGFNRRLLIPDINGVATFPFVVWAMPGSNAPVPDPTKDLAEQVNKVLADIVDKGIVAPAVGSNWLAAGINFTSFEVVNSFVLLTVIFGTRLEIDLLGLSRVVIPPGSGGSTGLPAVGYAELAIKASYVDGTGLISIQGQLTNSSYILSKSCHLTGGFAFYFWFSGDHEGDFVISLGGYNPNYTPPPYYPRVPPLGVNWQVSDKLMIKGALYFALTSNAVMAGGLMEAVWESGSIKAWFSIHADFLIMWKPFHYDISANTDIGASFTVNLLFTRKTITIHVGVAVHVWGPEFSGKATIHLHIISFTISFGAGSASKPTVISWDEFTRQLLPQQKKDSTTLLQDAVPDVCKLRVSNGLLLQLSDKEGELNWIVSPEKFELVTESVIPTKDWNLDNKDQPLVNIMLAPGAGTTVPNDDFGVRPVGIDSSSFKSTQIITISNDFGATATFHAVPILKNVPKALWQKIKFDRNGNPEIGDPLNNTTLQNVLTGFTLTPYGDTPANTLPIALQYLEYTTDPQLQHFTWGTPYVPTTDDFKDDTVPVTIMDAIAISNRQLLFAAILDSAFDIDTTINVDELADEKTYYLLADPVMRLLGEEKALVPHGAG